MSIFKWFFRGFIFLLGFYLASIPHRVFYWHIRFFGAFFRYVDRRRFANAMENLDFIFKDSMDISKKKEIIKRGYCNFAFLILESIRLPFLDKEKYLSRFSFIGEENLFSLLREGRNVVLVSAHFGYWEALGTAIPLRLKKEGLFYKMYSLGRLTGIEMIDSILRNRREIFNVTLIDKKGAFKKLLRIYTQSKVGTGILIDQNVDPNEGIEMDFLGKRATQTSITSIISRRFQCALIPVLIDFNEEYSRFILHIHDGIYCDKSEDLHEDIRRCTQKQIEIIERHIRSNPSSWLWFHKRWKSFFPNLYSR